MEASLPYLEQLFITRSHRYFVFILSVFGLAGLVCGYLWLGDERQQYRYLQQHDARLRQQLVIMREKISLIPATVIPALPIAAPIFSMTETLRQSRGGLIHWQPDKQHARLELSVAWERVPCLFTHIANYRGLILTSFSMTAASDAMAVILALEFSYENL